MENKELNNENIQNNVEQVQQVEAAPEPVPVQEVQQPRQQSAFNGNEEVLYTLEEEKEKNPIFILFVFVGLIAMVFILPLISKRIEFKVFQPTVETPGGTTEEKDDYYYFEKASTRAKIGTLELTNFVKSHENNEYKVSFTLNNVGEKSYDFSKKYYIVMYEGNKIIYRALIHSYEGLGALSATTLSLHISKLAFDNSNRFKLVEIQPATYPAVKTINEDGDYDVLICTYNYNQIKYYFKNEELHRIYDEYEEPKLNNILYEEHKTQYETSSNKYKQIKDLSSIFIETEEDFRMINEVNLKNISDVTMTQLRTYRFFKFKENIKTVSFEMEAQGYNCG